jgi:hypothetical protein
MATRPACSSSSGWSPSPWAIPASGQPGSPPSWPSLAGAPSSCRPMGCGGCCAATAGPPGAVVTGWSPATRPHRPRTAHPARTAPGPRPPGQLVQLDCLCIGRLSGTRARSGSTPPSTSPRPTPGRPCRSPGATPRRSGPASLPGTSPPTWPPAAGGWRPATGRAPPAGGPAGGRGQPRRGISAWSGGAWLFCSSTGPCVASTTQTQAIGQRLLDMAGRGL